MHIHDESFVSPFRPDPNIQKIRDRRNKFVGVALIVLAVGMAILLGPNSPLR